MISCSRAVQQLWDYLENDVTATDREKVEEHLAFCRTCCGEVEFAEELRSLLASAAEVTLPPDVEARLTGTLETLDADPTDDGQGPESSGPAGGAR